jgi:hypothetical protein
MDGELVPFVSMGVLAYTNATDSAYPGTGFDMLEPGTVWIDTVLDTQVTGALAIDDPAHGVVASGTFTALTCQKIDAG